MSELFDKSDIQRIKGLLGSLTHPDKKEILEYLRTETEISNVNIHRHIGKHSNWTDKQIKGLHNDNLITRSKQGVRVVYSLNTPYIIELRKAFKSLLKIMDNESK